MDVNVCPRGAWRTPVLFHELSKYLITFMTEATFKTVQHRKDKGKHYLCGGASFNHEVKAKNEQIELKLPGVFLVTETWGAKYREEPARGGCNGGGGILGKIL